MNIEKSLKIAMTIRDTNQTELASRMGVSRSYIGAIATGVKPVSMAKVAAICSFLDMKVSDFIILGEDEE